MLLNWHTLQYVLHSYSADTYRCNQSAALNWNGFCHGSAVRPSSLNEMSSQYITANWNVLVWYEESPVKIIMQMLALEQSGLKSPTTFTLWAQLAQISLFFPIQCDPDQIFLDSVNSKKKYIEPDFFYQVLALPPYIVKDQTQICWNATSVWIDSTTVDWMSVTQRCSKLSVRLSVFIRSAPAPLSHSLTVKSNHKQTQRKFCAEQLTRCAGDAHRCSIQSLTHTEPDDMSPFNRD